MKKSMILLALGLFAAAAFAKDTITPADPKLPSVEFSRGVDGVIKFGDMKLQIAIADGKVRTIEQLAATETERDTLKGQLAEASNVAAIFKQQRNEMASQVMDLTAQVALLRDEIGRLKQTPAKP